MRFITLLRAQYAARYDVSKHRDKRQDVGDGLEKITAVNISGWSLAG